MPSFLLCSMAPIRARHFKNEVIFMARKKRRGRPPGSKNKPKVVGSVGNMDVVQLSSHIESLRKMLAAKIEQQRAFFERQLAGLSGYANGGRTAASNGSRVGRPRAGTRKKP